MNPNDDSGLFAFSAFSTPTTTAFVNAFVPRAPSAATASGASGFTVSFVPSSAK